MGKFKLIVQSCEWHIFVHSKFLRRANSCMCLLMICAFLQTVHSCKKVNLSIKGGIVLGTTGIHMPFCNDAPQAQAKDLLSKEKHTWRKPPCQQAGGRGKGDLKQQFVQTSQFFLGRQSVTLEWTANLSKALPTPPSTHNTSSLGKPTPNKSDDFL